jgi:shikimate kinase
LLIFLVGFMGSGKTTVGRSLAAHLGLPFIDLDDEIERTAGMPIRDIFRERGESWFRALECDELRKACCRDHGVVALGGGAFCTAENQAIVSATGRSVWLDVPVDVVVERCAGEGTRPLATGREDMEQLLERRRPFYEKADTRVDATQSIGAVVAEILEWGSFHGIGQAANRDP